MKRIVFTIQGSAAAPYRVTFFREAGKLIAVCDCPAGQKGQCCKHRLGILTGDKSICAALAADDVAEVRSWLPGTSLESAIAEAQNAEVLVEEAQRAAKAAKKRLAAAMLGR